MASIAAPTPVTTGSASAPGHHLNPPNSSYVQSTASTSAPHHIPQHPATHNLPDPVNHTVSQEEVAWFFVQKYYTTLSHQPDRLHLLYTDRSSFLYGIEEEKSQIFSGRQQIANRIKELDFQDAKVRVRNVDSQNSDNNIVIQVVGEISNKSAPHRRFVQTFVLASQVNGYFVLNDVFRSLKDDDELESDNPFALEPESEPAPPPSSVHSSTATTTANFAKPTAQPDSSHTHVRSDSTSYSQPHHSPSKSASQAPHQARLPTSSITTTTASTPASNLNVPTSNSSTSASISYSSHTAATTAPSAPISDFAAAARSSTAVKPAVPAAPSSSQFTKLDSNNYSRIPHQATSQQPAPIAEQPPAPPPPAKPKTWASMAASANRATAPVTPAAIPNTHSVRPLRPVSLHQSPASVSQAASAASSNILVPQISAAQGQSQNQTQIQAQIQITSQASMSCPAAATSSVQAHAPTQSPGQTQPQPLAHAQSRANASGTSATSSVANQTSLPQSAPTIVSSCSANENTDSSESGWQTVICSNQDHSRRSRIQHSESAVFRAYIKNVYESIPNEVLRTTLAKFGEVVYCDISRQKNCAFVDFATANGFFAAVKANPHKIGNDQIYVEERRFRSPGYGYRGVVGIRGGRGGSDNRSGPMRGGYKDSRGGGGSGYNGRSRGNGAGSRGRGQS